MDEIIKKVKGDDRGYRNKGVKIICYADAVYSRMKTICKDSCIDLNGGKI
jgi:hypothetical protein